ncbi:dermonecrotic toxin domain-containing protein [Pseudomonas sp. NPDC087346]|uniref:dermonecrotic toxin domain-containing protein n=1 Tax=Pseudomonas sp. NPDC087346 TaxID=3364438 RepID=UPI0037F353D0
MPESTTPSAVDVLTQLVSGPSLTEVASNTLIPILAKMYPLLSIDPTRTMVATPTWIINNDGIEAGPCQFESLTDVLVRLALSGTAVTFIDGEHFLTQQPRNELSIQLAVEIEAVGAVLNEFAPLLFRALQEQQIDYWNNPFGSSMPRWHQLSHSLQQLWNVSADNGWDTDEQAMARAVFTNPDKTARTPSDPYRTRAYLIDLDLDAGSASARAHLNILEVAVLVGTLGQRTLIITHSITQGFRRFDSFAGLEKSLQLPLGAQGESMDVKWRLFEPLGNFFDQQACTLIALEAEAIGDIDFFQRPDRSAFVPHLGAGDGANATAQQPSPRLTGREHPLPQWLASAAPADQSRYSRHLLDLVAIQQQNAGKTFQEEVPGIQVFTLTELNKAISRAPARNARLQDVEMTITSLVVWGTFVPPEHEQTLTLSLVELALQNLAGLPLGNKSVHYRDGVTPTPSWMTPAYLENLVTAADIGKTYPALLKNSLIEDQTQATHLRQLYCRQLPVELPLLALQHKIRGEAGLDEQGYQYVVAALAAEPTERRVDGQEIVIRALAFVIDGHTGDNADEVVNMFVIGPRDADKGPCLLYRPLLDAPLLQYPSTANLLYAIRHSRTLRQSVLAWLPDSVRFNYSQYVFPGALPSVWTIPQLLIDPKLSPDLAGTVSLGNRVLEHDVPGSLFLANAEALITQADRDSVSNAEARWATLKRGGWALFNAALPFLGRGVGTAAWIWQIMDNLQEIAEGQEQQQPAWTALTDILLSLGMALAHRAATRKTPQRGAALLKKKPQTANESIVPGRISIARLPDIAEHKLPHNHELSLHAIGALENSPTDLATVLDSLKISRPEELTAPATEGLHRYLHSNGQKWFAPVGARWFEVAVNDNDDVQIIDTRQQSRRTGPLLVGNARGEWFVDLRLRLRAGGLKSRLKQLQEKNAELLRKKKQDIAVFDASLEDKRNDLVNVRRSMLEATPENAASARQQFLDTLDTQINDYSTHIESLKELNILEAVPNYRTAMLDRFSLQLFLMQSWIDETFPAFRENLEATLALLESNVSTPAADRYAPFESMSNLTKRLIEKIRFAHTRFAQMMLLGKEAVEISRQYKARLPSFSLEDLKLLQITLGSELCLKADPASTHAGARLALESLIEDASLNIQSVLDLGSEQSFNQLGERVEAMNNLVEQFDVIDQRFADLLTEYPQQVVPEQLDQIKEHVAEFHQDAVQQLSSLLRDQRLLEPVAGPSKSPVTPAKKIIKTRYKGTLVGQPRRGADGQDSHLVDVVAPLTGKVIATFHEKSPGTWVERVPAKPLTSARPNHDLPKSLQAGQELLDGVSAFKRRTQAHIERAQRNPTEIEEIYYLHAARLREAMEKIDQALTAGNHTASKIASAAVLQQSLDAEATTLYARGRAARIEITKQQAPTAARVEWLYSKGEVTIDSASERRRLKGPRKDYLLEYPILDKPTGKVLWYAHFHYAGATDPLPTFTAAHLKTVEQRRLGGAYVARENRSNQELIAIHRSTISHAQADALFFHRLNA